ncbi:MAG TPA: PHP domain-containing protein [Acidimicrobiales bacterium]|nr:PHP domain-containing protein [Acidimicrobiales bacterium]
MLDYHLHLWPHGRRAEGETVDRLAAYCERAKAAGVAEIAVTEHLFRFSQADAVLAGFWDDDPDPTLRATMAAYWADHAREDLDAYVEAALAAKAAGLPVVLGLEVDHYAGRMADVADLLADYPFDVLLGSVHWIGAWGFDVYENAVVAAEWDRRGTETAWQGYTGALEELAASGVCDVLAHPDLCMVTGRFPAVPAEFYDRMAEAAAASGMAAEVSSAGWRKPVGRPYPAPELLRRFAERGVPVTTASDAHGLPDVADRSADLRRLVEAAGYTELAAFRERRRRPVQLAAVAAGTVPDGRAAR